MYYSLKQINDLIHERKTTKTKENACKRVIQVQTLRGHRDLQTRERVEKTLKPL